MLTKIIFCFLFLINVCFAGGSTIVGDGGYAVDCKHQTYLLDRLEFLLENDWNEQETRKNLLLREHVEIVAKAIANDYSLGAKEKSTLLKAARKVAELDRPLRRPYENVTSLSSVELWLRTKKIVLDRRLLYFIEDYKCSLVPVATLITKKQAQQFDMQEACMGMNSTHCLIVDELIFKEMKIRDKKCLITHELLRLVPNSYQSERELRNLTIKYCSL